MLSPEYLDAAPEALLELMRTLEDDILRDAARRIGQAGRITDAAQWQLWRLEQLQGLGEDVLRRLAQYSGQTEEALRRIFQASGTAALAQDDEVYQAAGLAPAPVNASPALVNLLNAGYRQTLGSWRNLTATTAHTVTGAFERALDRAWLQIASGAFDYQTAVKRAVDSLADHMDGVTYPSGHRDTLEVAARRAVLTGVNQTAARLQLARAGEMGCDFVEVTAHAGARPEHALWQGRVYHRGGAVTVDGVRYEDFASATGYGTGAGLCGWNCRHNFYPFFPGLSEPAYRADELAAYNARDREYQGKRYTRYELSQMQRALERRVRRWKRRYLAEEAAGADSTSSAARLRTAREQLRQFVRQTGLSLDSARTGVVGFGPAQAAQAAAGAARYYRVWADVPGFQAPESLAEYYRIKYNEPERWARLRRDHDTLLKIDQKSWSPEFKQKAVDTFLAFQAEGIEISDHGVARFLDRSRGKNKKRPYTFDDIVAQMKLPFNYRQDDGNLVRYYYGRAIILTADNQIITIITRDSPKGDWGEYHG